MCNYKQLKQVIYEECDSLDENARCSGLTVETFVNSLIISFERTLILNKHKPFKHNKEINSWIVRVYNRSNEWV